jgi:hypothetical protein
MESANTNISIKQLHQATVAGKHLVETPITGYKKITCTCEEIPNFLSKLIGKPTVVKTTNALAELEIPKGAVIIRPKISTMDYFGNVTNYVGTKLRTDHAILRNVKYGLMFEKIGNSNCTCYSSYNNNYKYNIGQEHTPIQPFNNDITYECTSGIHFFLSEDDAKHYIF